MMRFALAGRCVWCGVLASRLGFSNDPSAAVPIPAAMRPKKWRRVMNKRGSIRLAFGQKLIEIHDHAGNRRPGRQFALVQLRIGFTQKLFGCGGILTELGELLVEGI